MRTLLADDEVVVLVIKHVSRTSVVSTAECLRLLTVIAPEGVWRLLETDALLLAVRPLVSRADRTLGIPLLQILLVQDFSD